MRKSPLEQPGLSEIEHALNEGRLEDAQHLLAGLPEEPETEGARVYFATRLLFERGRLDRQGVIERVRELLQKNPDFSEAERLLQSAEHGALEPHGDAGELGPHSRSPLEMTTDHAAPPSSSTPLSARLHVIPRAPLVPRFGTNERSPSYVPPPPSEVPSERLSSFDVLTSRSLTEPPATIPSPEPPPPSSLGDHVAPEAQLLALFGDAESALVSGRPELAIERFERACRNELSSLTPLESAENWASLADAAARLFSELPVFCNFVPYDSSVFSLERLSAALGVLFGAAPEQDAADSPGVLLSAAYLGETVRRAFGGEWHGTPNTPQTAFVQALGLTLKPCEQVALAVRNRRPLQFEQPARLHPAADPYGNSTPLSIAPPTPWDPEPWPTLQRLTAIGRLLPSSVVGVYCARQARPLDHSPASVEALDRYVALLAPPSAPPALEAPWVRRAAVFVGAYVGEVLIRTRGAHWCDPNPSAGAHGYILALTDGITTEPVAHALARLSGRTTGSLAEYTRALL